MNGASVIRNVFLLLLILLLHIIKQNPFYVIQIAINSIVFHTQVAKYTGNPYQYANNADECTGDTITAKVADKKGQMLIPIVIVIGFPNKDPPPKTKIKRPRLSPGDDTGCYFTR